MRRCSAVRWQAWPRPRPCAPASRGRRAPLPGGAAGSLRPAPAPHVPARPGDPRPVGLPAAGSGRREGRGRRLVGAALAAAQHDQRVFDDLTELGLAEGPLTPRIALGLLEQLPRTA